MQAFGVEWLVIPRHIPRAPPRSRSSRASEQVGRKSEIQFAAVLLDCQNKTRNKFDARHADNHRHTRCRRFVLSAVGSDISVSDMSGPIVCGQKVARVVKRDVINEPRLCLELQLGFELHHAWATHRVRDAAKVGAAQLRIWCCEIDAIEKIEDVGA